MFRRLLLFVGLIAISSTAAMAQDKLPPTHPAVMYGPHKRNVMDVWIAPSDTPTPLLVTIHGGAFENGTKHVGPGLRHLCLKAKISVAAITYRLSNDAIAPAAFYDAARAIQFLRYKAPEWGLDPQRIGATGDSAGAGISLWLAFHDDLADSQQADPVLRQSTRLTCVATKVGQTSYDPRFIKQLFPDSTSYKAAWAEKFFGTRLDQLDNLPPEKYRLFEEVSPLNYVTKDDPPVLQIYGVAVDSPPTDAIHHPRFGKVLKDKMDALGIPCQIVETLRSHENAVFEFMQQHLAKQ